MIVKKTQNIIVPATGLLLVKSLLTMLILSSAFVSNNQRVSTPVYAKQVEVRGIYGSPDPFWKKGFRLDHLGVNAVFVHDKSISAKLIERAKSEGARVFAEFATLNGKGYIDEHPEAWAINMNGTKVKPASWFMGVCPTEPGFRQHRMKELTTLLQTFDLDGVWMDYLHWHAQFEEPEPILEETCFCKSCMALFQSASGIELPGNSTEEKARWILTNHDSTWRNWRCAIIAGWVRDFKMIIKQQKPGVLLGVYHCPWNDDDFGGARRKILGLDYDSLRENVDVFSPMVYHRRMGRNSAWVKENVEWFCNRLKIKAGKFPKVWPIVQSYNDPGIISATEFEKVLQYGLSGEATGVIMFTSSSVAEENGKIEAMKKVYGHWSGAP